MKVDRTSAGGEQPIVHVPLGALKAVLPMLALAYDQDAGCTSLFIERYNEESVIVHLRVGRIIFVACCSGAAPFASCVELPEAGVRLLERILDSMGTPKAVVTDGSLVLAHPCGKPDRTGLRVMIWTAPENLREENVDAEIANALASPETRNDGVQMPDDQGNGMLILDLGGVFRRIAASDEGLSGQAARLAEQVRPGLPPGIHLVALQAAIEGLSEVGVPNVAFLEAGNLTVLTTPERPVLAAIIMGGPGKMGPLPEWLEQYIPRRET